MNKMTVIAAITAIATVAPAYHVSLQLVDENGRVRRLHESRRASAVVDVLVCKDNCVDFLYAEFHTDDVHKPFGAGPQTGVDEHVPTGLDEVDVALHRVIRQRVHLQPVSGRGHG